MSKQEKEARQWREAAKRLYDRSQAEANFWFRMMVMLERRIPKKKAQG